MRQSEPEPIREDELYDLQPEAPIPLFPQARPDPAADEDAPLRKSFVSHEMVEAANASPLMQGLIKPRPDPPQPEPLFPGPKTKADARFAAVSVALDILSFRLILLLCCAASAGLFFMASLWPDQWRLAAAVAFSAVVTLPCMIFYRKVE
jgi:hypothetical protein